jgi:hypothetical protein
LTLSPADLAAIERAVSKNAAAGSGYPEMAMAQLDSGKPGWLAAGTGLFGSTIAAFEAKWKRNGQDSRRCFAIAPQI